MFIALDEKEREYILGMFFGDGYKYYDEKQRHYDIEFYLNSKRDSKIIELIMKILSKMELKPILYDDRRYSCKRIRVRSKELFKTFEKNTLLLDKSNDFCIGFVSGLIDAEGYVDSKKSSLSIMNTNRDILEDCQKFLNRIGIHSSISLRKKSMKDKLKSYRMYISVKFKSLPHLSIKAG